MNLNLTRTPTAVAGPIVELCRRLVADPRPVFIAVTPEPGATPRDCFPVVEERAKAQGGAIQYGWQIWEWPRVMVEAEFHAVWQDPEGHLHDLTPKDQPDIDRILFLPDPERAYRGQQIDNVRQAVAQHPAVKDLIRAAEAEFEIMNRGDRAHEHGEVKLSGDEAQELMTWQQARAEAMGRILEGPGRPGRNDPCPCGSGTKYKRCHGR